jgi:SpoVK/Ycf46/Vps4 family AAA+-type ATPase
MDGISAIAGGGTKERDAAEAAAGGGEGEGEDGEAPGSKQVVVLAASNLPWELDDAFRRR